VFFCILLLMKNKNPKLSLLSEHQRSAATREIINFFSTEMDDEIGLIAAEDILDMFLDRIGNSLYNKGVEDAIHYAKEQHQRIAFDMEMILKK